METVERQCIDELRKQVCFDGINFWLNDEKIGRVSETNTVMSKDVMVAEKEKCIKRLMLCEVC